MFLAMSLASYSFAHPYFPTLTFHRINKRGSQKDEQQKKSGNYFFYDDPEDDAEPEDFDDI
jgi:hypothetical protein